MLIQKRLIHWRALQPLDKAEVLKLSGRSKNERIGGDGAPTSDSVAFSTKELMKRGKRGVNTGSSTPWHLFNASKKSMHSLLVS